MIPPDLHSQMLRMLDGELSAGELAALEAELEVNPEARRLWQKLSRIHSALEVHYTSKAKVAQSPVVPIDLVLARQRRRVVKNSLLAAAALILISATGLWLVMAPAAPAGFADFRAASQSVFTLTHAGEGQSPMGHALAEGSRLVLDHGVAELDLPHKVRGIIEAPAVIEMVDDKNLKLDHGRAFFHVGSEAGRGFTVVTPHQRIVDLGTRFGIDAPRGRDEVELHVFEGTVRVDALDGGQGETINATRSVVLEGSEVSRELEGAPAAFRRQLPEKVETLLHEDFESGLLAGRDYAVRMDPTAIRDLSGNRFSGIDDDTTWNFSVGLPANVPIPVQSYVYGKKPGRLPDHPLADSENVKLTDGKLGATSGWSSGTYIGWNAQPITTHVTFDLGSVVDVAAVHVYAENSYGSGAAKPDSVTVSVSRDNVNFSAPAAANLSFFADSGVRSRAVLDISPWGEARYYRLEFSNADTNWMMLSEIQFTSASTADPIIQAGDLERAFPVPEPLPSLSDRDRSAPVLRALYPEDDAVDVHPSGELAMVFDEPIKLGTGRIFLRNRSDWSQHEIAVGGGRTSVDGRILRIYPPADLPDGRQGMGWISGWDSETLISLINPSGNGTWYAGEGLKDQGRARGTMGSMRGPLMVALGPGAGIRREFGNIAPDHCYTVSAAIGVRSEEAESSANFLGYTIRLLSGDTVLAELSDDTPPGPPNSVTSICFSWDSNSLPESVNPGDPLTLEVTPNENSGMGPGYLDLAHVRVSVVGE